ncbi:hypothetical protein GCM10009687_63460 [Asanoa iriomotensis]|uniref:Resolvase/invertase-type recombinase catalytic domain-containing protein n=1 Tax=Asanoa iriomotensis TaxID=234613 RepID=A0ABQ4C8Y8_9ACTN|nr:hypothetical protein Air01nite_53520 [Asanoa iriomotensis]
MQHRRPTRGRLRVATYMRVADAGLTSDESIQEQAERVRAVAESLGWQPIAVFAPARTTTPHRRLRRR